MKTWGKLLVLSVAFGAVLLAPSHSNAAASGKIYINGKWESANVVEKSSIWDLSGMILGTKPKSIRQLAEQFLDENSPLLKMDSNSTWKTTQQQIGSELSTVRSAKTWKGLPVVGGDSVRSSGQR